eukprot:545817_1
MPIQTNQILTILNYHVHSARKKITTCLTVTQWILILYCLALVSYNTLRQQNKCCTESDPNHSTLTVKDHFTNNSTISDINYKITALQNQIHSNDVDISDLKSVLNGLQNTKSFHANISTINTKITDLQNQIYANDVDILDLKSVSNIYNISSINISNIKTVINSLQNQIHSNDVDLLDLKSTVDVSTINISNLNAIIDNVQTQIVADNADLNSLDNDLQTQINSNDVDISNLTARVSNLESSSSQSSTGLIQMQSTISHTKVTVSSNTWIEPSTDYRVIITPKYTDSKILISYHFGWNGYGLNVNTIVSWAA